MLNKYMIIGNLGQDPDTKFTDGGTAYCRLSIATNRSWKDKDGNKKDETTWHRVVVWGKQAEACGEYLKKGRQVFVEGRFQSREYEANGEKRYSSECVAERVQFLKDGSSGQGGQGGGRNVPPPSSDEEIPF